MLRDQVIQICRALEISEQAYYRWRKEYGGLSTIQALKELENKKTAISHLQPIKETPFIITISILVTSQLLMVNSRCPSILLRTLPLKYCTCNIIASDTIYLGQKSLKNLQKPTMKTLKSTAIAFSNIALAK